MLVPLSLFSLVAPSIASAQSAFNTTFEVSADIAMGCWIDGVGQNATLGRIASLDFGTSPAGQSASKSASTLSTQSYSIRCTPATTLRLAINEGRNADQSTRRLQRGSTGQYIDYRLCSYAGCLIGLAKSFATVIPLPTLENYYNYQLELYAETNIPAGLPPGLYTDDIMVTLSW